MSDITNDYEIQARPAKRAEASRRPALRRILPILATATAFASAIGLGASTAQAGTGPGVLEMNQVCAVETGCFPGDAPGFPITITGEAGSSYLLTGDLTVNDLNTDVIQISANGTGTTIDLGGHELRGPNECTYAGTSGVTCLGSGFGDGIDSFVDSVRVHNGHVRGMGSAGIRLRENSIVQDVHLSENGVIGFTAGDESRIQDSAVRSNGSVGVALSSGGTAHRIIATRNHFVGIRGLDGLTVTESTVSSTFSGAAIQGGTQARISGNDISRCGGPGIQANEDALVEGNNLRAARANGIQIGENGLVRDNIVKDTTGVGILTGSSSIISGNSIKNSTENGIIANRGSVIRENAIFENGTTTSDDGVYCNLGCVVDRNAIRSNAGPGLRFDSLSSIYTGNSISANAGGTVVGGQDGGSNICELALSCP